MQKRDREIRQCERCGTEFSFRPSPSKVAAGRGRFCSRRCSTSAQHTVHGLHGSPEHRQTYCSWQHMLQRCYNPSDPKFPRYGGAGVTVCDQWRDSFPAFLSDMGLRPDGTTIDRIDGKCGYEPGNCRWATPHQQQRNLNNNVWITYQGKTKCLRDWSRQLGIDCTTIRYRLKQGWPTDRVMAKMDYRKTRRPMTEKAPAPPRAA